MKISNFFEIFVRSQELEKRQANGTSDSTSADVSQKYIRISEGQVIATNADSESTACPSVNETQIVPFVTETGIVPWVPPGKAADQDQIVELLPKKQQLTMGQKLYILKRMLLK